MADTLWSKVVDAPAAFEDIRIVDLDVSRTTWSRIHQDLRVMYLTLSAHPPDLQWIKFFHEERESRVMMVRRGLWIEHGTISFDCFPHEVERYHLPDIQRSVDGANQKYREYLSQRARDAQRDRDSEADEKVVLEALQHRMRSKFGADAAANGSVSPGPQVVPQAPAAGLGEASQPAAAAPPPDPLQLSESDRKLHDDELEQALRKIEEVPEDDLAQKLARFRAQVRNSRKPSG